MRIPEEKLSAPAKISYTSLLRMANKKVAYNNFETNDFNTNTNHLVMKPIQLTTFFLFSCLCFTGCWRSNMTTETINIPELEGKPCFDALSNPLLRQGMKVQPLNPDYTGGIIVTYDKMQVARKNIEHAIASKGYAANEIAPYPGATKPTVCK